MHPFALEVADNSTHLTVSPPGSAQAVTLSAHEIDALIRELVRHRATMTPIQPAEPPQDPNLLYRNDNLLIKIGACENVPAIEIAIQHPGLGWAVTRLGRDQAEDMQALINFALRAIPERATAA